MLKNGTEVGLGCSVLLAFSGVDVVFKKGIDDKVLYTGVLVALNAGDVVLKN